jgi:hypothetical protein
MPLLAAEIPAKLTSSQLSRPTADVSVAGNRRTNVHIIYVLKLPPAYANQALDCSIYFLSKTKVMFVTNGNDSMFRILWSGRALGPSEWWNILGKIVSNIMEQWYGIQYQLKLGIPLP